MLPIRIKYIIDRSVFSLADRRVMAPRTAPSAANELRSMMNSSSVRPNKVIQYLLSGSALAPRDAALKLFWDLGHGQAASVLSVTSYLSQRDKIALLTAGQSDLKEERSLSQQEVSGMIDILNAMVWNEKVNLSRMLFEPAGCMPKILPPWIFRKVMFDKGLYPQTLHRLVRPLAGHDIDYMIAQAGTGKTAEAFFGRLLEKAFLPEEVNRLIEKKLLPR
ncbi:MAG: hypothetical protein WC490_08145 [Candidatus Margulisiibacteriota bacterium]